MIDRESMDRDWSNYENAIMNEKFLIVLKRQEDNRKTMAPTCNIAVNELKNEYYSMLQSYEYACK